jgi:hypothetical protein
VPSSFSTRLCLFKGNPGNLAQLQIMHLRLHKSVGSIRMLRFFFSI